MTNTNTTKEAMRGLGRSAYRFGTMASSSIAYAARSLGCTISELSDEERCEVMAGWTAERSDEMAVR